MNTLYILCGLPGSMKSSEARYIMNQSLPSREGALIVSGDSIRTMIRGQYAYDEYDEKVVYDLAVSSIYTISRTRRDIIYDEVNLTVEDRRKMIDLAYEIGYQPVIVYCKSDGKHLERRMAEPKGFDPERWRRVIYQMERYFVPPSENEGRSVILVEAGADREEPYRPAPFEISGL